MFVGLFSGKIIGLELFGVLQLGYFSIGSHGAIDLYVF